MFKCDKCGEEFDFVNWTQHHCKAATVSDSPVLAGYETFRCGKPRIEVCACGSQLTEAQILAGGMCSRCK